MSFSGVDPAEGNPPVMVASNTGFNTLPANFKAYFDHQDRTTRRTSQKPSRIPLLLMPAAGQPATAAQNHRMTSSSSSSGGGLAAEAAAEAAANLEEEVNWFRSLSSGALHTCKGDNDDPIPAARPRPGASAPDATMTTFKRPLPVDTFKRSTGHGRGAAATATTFSSSALGLMSMVPEEGSIVSVADNRDNASCPENPENPENPHLDVAYDDTGVPEPMVDLRTSLNKVSRQPHQGQSPGRKLPAAPPVIDHLHQGALRNGGANFVGGPVDPEGQHSSYVIGNPNKVLGGGHGRDPHMTPATRRPRVTGTTWHQVKLMRSRSYSGRISMVDLQQPEEEATTDYRKRLLQEGGGGGIYRRRSSSSSSSMLHRPPPTGPPPMTSGLTRSTSHLDRRTTDGGARTFMADYGANLRFAQTFSLSKRTREEGDGASVMPGPPSSGVMVLSPTTMSGDDINRKISNATTQTSMPSSSTLDSGCYPVGEEGTTRSGSGGTRAPDAAVCFFDQVPTGLLRGTIPTVYRVGQQPLGEAPYGKGSTGSESGLSYSPPAGLEVRGGGGGGLVQIISEVGHTPSWPGEGPPRYLATSEQRLANHQADKRRLIFGGPSDDKFNNDDDDDDLDDPARPLPPDDLLADGWRPPAGPGRMDDKQSTLSRYWTMDRSLQRRLQKTNYQHIKRLCRDRGQLFEDNDFPANNRSLFKHRKPPMFPIVWLRPHEICQRPKFIAEGATRFDVEQGEQGDPWLLAAISSLTLTPRFLDRVVPPDQSFDHGYCGVFRFRFWHFGDWVEVLVDDKLPTYKGRLVYLHSTDPTEFWAALLEKAYAKLYSNYEALHSGFTTKALQDLTGGIVQSFSLNSQDRLLTYQVLNSAVPRSTLLIASINIDGRHEKRTLRLRNGLITRHAYSVTGLARVRGQLGDRHLVRLRNPWGKGEWNGPWSERSWEWDSLSDRDRDLLAVRVRNEGEFWMAFEDFASQFSHLDLVHVGPDDWMSEPALHSKRPWRAVLARRRWRSGYNAGGAPSYLDTTAMNPQFHIQIPRTGSGAGGGAALASGGGANNASGGGANNNSSTSSKCHVVVSVTQHYETNCLESKRKRKRKLHHIGFAVYEVPPHMTRLTPLYVTEHAPLDVTNHSVAREVVTFFTLPPGDYIVVPQTNVPNCDGKFLLRILTDEQSNIWEVNEDNVLFRNVLVEFEESFKYGYYDESEPSSRLSRRFRLFGSRSEGRILLSKLMQKYPPEVDAAHLQKILKSHWKAYLLQKPSLELCKSLVMLRDYNISGRLSLMEIPVLLHMLHFWKSAFLKYVPSGSGVKTSSFNLRLILWEAGITVSNKVLECLVLRFAKNKVILCEAYIIVMIRLHLAHERYHSIDTKMKGNPLSLEEMILMTIYS